MKFYSCWWDVHRHILLCYVEYWEGLKVTEAQEFSKCESEFNFSAVAAYQRLHYQLCINHQYYSPARGQSVCDRSAVRSVDISTYCVQRYLLRVCRYLLLLCRYLLLLCRYCREPACSPRRPCWCSARPASARPTAAAGWDPRTSTTWW